MGAKVNKWSVISIIAVSAIIGFMWFKIDKLQSELIRYKTKSEEKHLDGGVVISKVVETEEDGIKVIAKDNGLSTGVKDAEESGKKLGSMTVTTSNTLGSSLTNLDDDKKIVGRGTSVSSSPSVGPNQGVNNSVATHSECDKYSHSKTVEEVLSPSQTAPFGEVTYDATMSSPWSILIWKRTYKCSILDATDSDGNSTRYTKLELEVNNKKYDLDITNSVTYKTPLEYSWSFNPRLGSSVFFGGAYTGAEMSYGGSIGVNVFSLGYTNDSPEWYFLSIQGGYDISRSKSGLVLYPVLYNVKNVIPFTRSTYLGVGAFISDLPLSIHFGLNFML